MTCIQTQHHNLAPSNSKSNCGFTLIELLTVMVIVSVVLGMGMSGIGSNREISLTSIGNKVVDYAYLARQQAISRNVPIALLVLTSDPTESPGAAYRAMTLAELQTDGWKQICTWELLPQGIVVDTNSSTFLQNAALSAVSGGNLSGLSFRGKAVQASDCAARVFLPTGGLLNFDQAAVIRLVQGSVDSSKEMHYAQRDALGSPANYYSIALLGVTGFSKIERK